MALRVTKGDENRWDRYPGGAGDGRGRNRSGAVEAARESDPDRAF
jgi:hypothetical protein